MSQRTPSVREVFTTLLSSRHIKKVNQNQPLGILLGVKLDQVGTSNVLQWLNTS